MSALSDRALTVRNTAAAIGVQLERTGLQFVKAEEGQLLAQQVVELAAAVSDLAFVVVANAEMLATVVNET